MGRNVFQAEHPIAMIQAIRAVVHDGAKPDKAYQLYQELAKSGAGKANKKSPGS